MTNQSNPRSETKSRRSAAPKSRAKTAKGSAKTTGSIKTGNGHANGHAPFWFPDLDIKEVAKALGSDSNDNTDTHVSFNNPVTGEDNGCVIHADPGAPYGFWVYVKDRANREEIEKLIIETLHLGDQKACGRKQYTAQEQKAAEDLLFEYNRVWYIELNPEAIAARLNGRVVESGGLPSVKFPIPYEFGKKGNDGDDGYDIHECSIKADLNKPPKPYGFELRVPRGADFKKIRQYVIDKLLLEETRTSKLSQAKREKLKEKTAEFISKAKRERRDYLKLYMRLYYEHAKPATRANPGPVGDYLSKRGVDMPENDEALRYLPCERFTDHRLRGEIKQPAFMVAMAFDPETHEERLIHLSVITPGGECRDYVSAANSKIVIKRKRTVGGSTPAYICLRKGANKTLWITEGIENGLSVFKLPEADDCTVWCVVSALGMAQLPALDAFDEIVIVQDIEPPKQGETVGPGRQAVELCAQRWFKAGKIVRILKPIPPTGKDKWDLNDIINVQGFTPGDGSYEIEDFTGMTLDKEDYIVDGNGKFVLNDTNIMILLAQSSGINPLLSFNEFYDDVMITGPLPGQTPHGPYPRPVDDSDWRALVGCVQRVTRFEKAGREHVFAGMLMFAEKRRVHPLRDYLMGLKWDGAPRVDTVFHDYLGVEDNEYTREVSGIFLKSAVVRVMRPGCKVDQSPLLIGPQRTFKSTFLRILAGEEYFGDSMPSLAGIQMKEAQEYLQTFWIVEIAENSAFRNVDSERQKNFLTMQDDAYRTPYGKRTARHPRKNVFAISTNLPNPLKDITGGRRYMPLKVGEAFTPTKAHMDRLKENRDQIWAEAFHRVMVLEEPWWSDPDDESRLFEPRQEAYREIEAWEEAFRAVMKQVERHRSVVIWPRDLMAFFFDLKRCSGKMIGPSQYSDMLKTLGWSSKNRKVVIRNPRKGKNGKRPVPFLVSTEPRCCWALADNPKGRAYRHAFIYHSPSNGQLGWWEIKKTWSHDPIDDAPSFAGRQRE